jgi:asparagine synthase (glutamine-hydrolysing)
MVDTLSEARTRQRGYFDTNYLDVLLDEHWRGRRDHSARLWSLLMLELWHREFVDQHGPRRDIGAEVLATSV